MRRASLIVPLALTASLGGLAACSSSGSSGAGSASSVTQVNKPATGTISYEAWTPTASELAQIVRSFKKQNPRVTVNTKLEPDAAYLAALKTEMASATGPDVFALQPGAQFNEFSSFMEPLNKYLTAALGPNWKSRFDPMALARGQSGSQQLALPMGNQAAGLMWVNQTMLQKYHLPVPHSYAQLKSDTAVLKQHGLVGLALGAKDPFQDTDYFMTIANATAKTKLYAALDGRAKWTDPSLVNVFAQWKQLFTDSIVQPGAVGDMTYNDAYNLFVDQKAAFFANGSWNMDMFVNSASQISKFQVAVVPFTPPGASGYAPVIDDPNLLMINKNSSDPVAAFKFMAFQIYGAGAQTLNNSFLDYSTLKPPVQPTVPMTASARQVRSQIGTILRTDVGGYRNIPKAAVNDALAQALQGVASGQLSPRAAAQQVASAASGG